MARTVADLALCLQGMIGSEPFRVLLRTRRLQHAIKVLEVPGGEDAYREDLALLRRLQKK